MLVGIMANYFVSGPLTVILLLSLTSAKPIMVTFGTKQGPIVPRPPKQISPVEIQRRVADLSPAPVSEEVEDLPNPTTYRPLVPLQYRNKIYSAPPPSNLVLGTPLDQRYRPSPEKYNLYRKAKALNIQFSPEYTGPQFFDKQQYEINLENKYRTTLQPSVRYIKPEMYSKPELYSKPEVYDGTTRTGRTQSTAGRVVPQIGVIYSAGVRYYIPQFVYNNVQQEQQKQEMENEENHENSVYAQSEQKYYY